MGGPRGQRAAPRAAAAHAPASASPPLPPPLPPSAAPSLEDLANVPVRIYPADRPSTRANASHAAAPASAASARLLQALQAVHKHAVVVAILGADVSSPTGLYTFANRLIGRVAFMENNAQDSALGANASLAASIQLVYDESRSILFLLGVSKPELAFLESLNDGVDDLERDFGAELAQFQNEKRKMELLLHSSSHLLFQFSERGRFTTAILKTIRALAADKQSLLAQLSASNGKPAKRSDKQSASSNVNVLAPGRCVPLAMFVVPVRDDILNAKHKQLAASATLKSRSTTVAFCKAHETMLCGLFRSLRGGLVGSLRTRDAVTPANLSKERRLFHVDPAHCVAVISTSAATETGSLASRFESVLDSFSIDFLCGDSAEPFDLDAILQPLEEDDVGFPHAIQHLTRGVELVQSVAAATGSKDPSGVRVDLLTVAQWLKAFHALTKTLHRMEIKKKQDNGDAVAHQLDAMDLRS